MVQVTREYREFDPKAYLEEYYAHLPPENIAVLQFLISEFQHVPSGNLTLDFGGGPCLYNPIVAANRASEIHFSEYTEANRAEVQRWLAGDPTAFDWGGTIQKVLELEGETPSLENLRLRESIIRQRVTRVIACDIDGTPPVASGCDHYDVVVTMLCLEAGARDFDHWREAVHRVTALLKPGGRLVMIAVRGGNAYLVGHKVFPIVRLYEDDVRGVLQGAGYQDVRLEIAPADHAVHPYEGLMFIGATRANTI